LGTLGIDDSTEILFVADGARWIWNRVGELVDSLGIDASRYRELVDFRHAVENLSSVAELKKGWSGKERKGWVKKHRRLLLEEKID
jgi:hypothetical protein